MRAVVRARRDDALTRLRLGFTQLRRGELEQDPAQFSHAAESFEPVTKTYADWPVAWFGLGLARLNLVDNQSSLAGGAVTLFLGGSIHDAAVRIARSAEVDSEYVEGLVKLSDIALQDYHPAHLRAALLALRHVARKPVAVSPAVQLARIRIERVAGSLDSAERLAGDLLQRQPADPVTLMEVGRVSLGLGDEAGAESWFRGLALADSVTAQLYRSDLVLLLPDSILMRFDAIRGEARVDAVRRFLEVDEFGQLRSAAGRLREHYRRLDHARMAFAAPTAHYVADGVVGFRPTGHEMDERGLVWVLHGPPDDHTYLNLVGIPPNESWHYRGSDGGELLFHFIKTGDSVGFHRVSSIFDILALSKPLQATGHGDVKAMAARGEAVQTYGAGWTAQTVEEILYSRESTSPTYGRMLSQGRNGALALQNEERATGDSSMRVGETHTVHYELPLEARLDAVAVGSDSAGSWLQVAFAIPGTSLYAAPAAGPVVYPVRMRLSVMHRGTNELVTGVDTLRNFIAPAPIPPDGALLGRLPVRIPPGDYTVTVALETPSRGVQFPREDVHVAAAAGQQLDLSDLALGVRSVRLPWQTPRGDSVWINPLRQFNSGEPMQLYFEVAGIAAGARYQAALTIYRAGEQRPQLRLAFSATAAAKPDAVQRQVDIGRLKPGSYQLQVTVSTVSGQQATRRREFTVVK